MKKIIVIQGSLNFTVRHSETNLSKLLPHNQHSVTFIDFNVLEFCHLCVHEEGYFFHNNLEQES